MRRRIARLTAPLWRLATWVFLAAGALVGFEVLEALLGGLVLAPEIVPIVLLCLALVWLVRERLDIALRWLGSQLSARRTSRRGGRMPQ